MGAKMTLGRNCDACNVARHRLSVRRSRRAWTGRCDGPDSDPECVSNVVRMAWRNRRATGHDA